MSHWITPHLRQPLVAHLITAPLSLRTACGESVTIYRRAEQDDDLCDACAERSDEMNRDAQGQTPEA